MADVKALSDIAARQTAVADADLLFVERGGSAAGITGENLKNDIAGRLINRQIVNTVGNHTVTPTAGAKKWIVIGVGTGGNGGAADSDVSGASGDAAAAAGGSSAPWCKFEVDVTASSYSVDITIGARGTRGSVAGGVNTDGTQAADTTFTTSDGIEITIPGGKPGANNMDQLGAGGGGLDRGDADSATVDTGSPTWFEAYDAGEGEPGWISPANSTNAGAGALGGAGGAVIGAAAAGRLSNAGRPATAGRDGPSAGAGGSGASTVGTESPVQGGWGAYGQFEIWEYS